MPQKLTPEDLQAETIKYLRGLKTTERVYLEVWVADEDSGEQCRNNSCHRVGFVYFNDCCYCAAHSAMLILAARATERTRHVSVDVARPICIPDELAASEDLLELVRNLMYFIADSKGSTVTKFVADRATALGNRCTEALKARNEIA